MLSTLIALWTVAVRDCSSAMVLVYKVKAGHCWEPVQINHSCVKDSSSAARLAAFLAPSFHTAFVPRFRLANRVVHVDSSALHSCPWALSGSNWTAPCFPEASFLQASTFTDRRPSLRANACRQQVHSPRRARQWGLRNRVLVDRESE